MAVTAQRERSISAFLQELGDILREGFQTAAVHEYLRSTLIQPTSLEPYVSFRSDRYTRNLIHKSAEFELLAICWNIGHRAPIHGHEGERCWSRVEKGNLCFTNYREVSEFPLVLEKLSEPLHGRRGHLDGPADIHEVENLSDFGEPAISLHVYARPYDWCDIYDISNGKKQRVRLAYDTTYGKAV